MTDNKTIGISSLITLGIVLLSMVTPGFFDTPKYYCETRLDIGIVECDSFSKYVSEVGKCIRDDDTNLVCRDGWVQVINDIPEESEQTSDPNNDIPIIILENPYKYISYKDVMDAALELKKEYGANEFRCNSDLKKCCVFTNEKLDTNKCDDIKSQTIMEISITK